MGGQAIISCSSGEVDDSKSLPAWKYCGLFSARHGFASEFSKERSRFFAARANMSCVSLQYCSIQVNDDNNMQFQTFAQNKMISLLYYGMDALAM